MCGIAGLGGVELHRESQGRVVADMIEAIRHRGPDGGGVAAHEDATIGMRRLAIVDVAGGDQPMWSDDRTIVIVYNGEVYNAPSIRNRLERKGIRFRTRSDTEVILRMYEHSPESLEQDLVGMWAFAIHDRKRKRLVLSRDRFGIKPLFIASAGERSFAFASELRAFRPLVSALYEPFGPLFRVDEEAAHAMVAWSYVPETRTIYRRVARVPPASRLEIDLATGKREQRVYWHLVPSGDAQRVRDVREAAELIDPLLRRSVCEHLVSDVPVATFLSGGVDSSLVTAYAVEESSRPITAYSVGFRERRFDESPFARETARLLGIEHDLTILDEPMARACVADALLAYDEPFGDSSSIASLLLAKQVAGKHKVALGGDGGDEAFAGYRKHRIVALRQQLSHFDGVRRVLVAAFQALPARTDRTSAWGEVLRTAKRIARGLDGSDAEAYATLTQVVPLARTAPLMRVPTAAKWFLDEAIERFSSVHGTLLQKTLVCDLSSPLANDMLTKVDRATMAVSIEARVPLLDHRVVQAGIGIPTKIATGKRVLKELHARRFGKRLANRKKRGFGVPVEKWLRGELAHACDEFFSTRRLDQYGILSSVSLGDGRWRAWASSDPQVLWHAFALAAWCEATMGGGPSVVRNILGDRRNGV